MPNDLDPERQLLRQRCREAGTVLLEAAGPEELGRAIGHGAERPLGLADHPWLQEAARHLPAPLRQEAQVFTLQELSQPPEVATAVIVGLGAIPETGSVLVTGTDPAAWRLSLCPRILKVVIPAAQATLSLAAALARTARDPSGLVSWLTGPSRTADIEKVLVLGAQGAAALHLILYQDAPSTPQE